jgi:hypothetical protein
MHQETSYCSGVERDVTVLAVTYVLSLSLFFYVRVILIDFHYLSLFCRALSLHIISLSLSFFFLSTTPFDSFSLHHTHCSSSSWLLLSVTYIFISARLSCAHCLLLVHHFIQYIRGFHSSTIHHILKGVSIGQLPNVEKSWYLCTFEDSSKFWKLKNTFVK